MNAVQRLLPFNMKVYGSPPAYAKKALHICEVLCFRFKSRISRTHFVRGAPALKSQHLPIDDVIELISVLRNISQCLKLPNDTNAHKHSYVMLSRCVKTAF